MRAQQGSGNLFCINKDTYSEKADEQIGNYIEKNAFFELREFDDVLIKYPRFSLNKHSISITWNYIINILHS